MTNTTILLTKPGTHFLVITQLDAPNTYNPHTQQTSLLTGVLNQKRIFFFIKKLVHIKYCPTFALAIKNTGVAQLVEHRSPKPSVGRSSRSSRASTGEVQEWLNWHAWKACKPLKGFRGSNPLLSASLKSVCNLLQTLFFMIKIPILNKIGYKKRKLESFPLML